MGVRGLQTFVEHGCPEACKYVSIKQLADAHRNHINCNPVIVVDGMSLLNRLYNNTSLEWIYGGQWLQFFNELEKFIERFKSIDVDLIFFFDGTVCASKREEWIRRRLQKSTEVASIFSTLKVNNNEPDRKFFQLPTSMGLLARFAVKELGSKVYQTDREADDVIAEYAIKNKEVFAILSQDSDFIIYNTKTYLSISHLNLDTLHTIHYDRKCFAEQYLCLYVEQLPLFACLAGNDFVPSDKLRNFHYRVCKSRRIHISAMAGNLSSIIRGEHWSGDFNNMQELNHISLAVFGNLNDSHLIYDGLKSYMLGSCYSPPKVCIVVDPSMERAVYERHLNCFNSPYIFNLLCNLEYESSEVLEDATRLPSALVFREIRQRCYGVLFNYFLKPNYQENQTYTKYGDAIVIKEWCAYKGNLMERPELIKPLPLDMYSIPKDEVGPIPRIEDLWFNFSGIQKLRFFWRILQIPMEFNQLADLPKEHIVLACILNYLIGGLKIGPILQPLEVAVFVAQALWRKSSEQLKQLRAPSVDTVAVNLSTLFMRGVTAVLMVLNVCDSPFSMMYAMPWRFFDGKLFHHLHNEAKLRPNVRELCGNQNDVIKDFYKLLPVVTNNTAYNIDNFDWRTVFEDFKYPF
ncbi:constitutive coactivator of peroxisome proliferator-activated receptor gamma [Trichonephila clavata]|uniref:Constitutive coactivator of peroxisome proliferator-activated receptor gamma n=1 Tax=Trichonephila clavata TaxID=2740835 RepID=A0A8X6JJB9_TRICU|nr:constitutive coactivator of peroxisome proliferator-activated receptor gamma [Trichonephila clavata]